MVMQRSFGQHLDGRDVLTLMIGNDAGMEVEILTYGGVIRFLSVPDREGCFSNVSLGFDDLASYTTCSPYFGAIIGRYANRIAAGKFAIDGVTYAVSVNDPPSSLHGGHEGFDKKIWSVVEHDGSSVTLHYISVDGEEGYPGTLDVTVRYSVGVANTLRIDYTATTDAPTPVNLTNHSYLNLAGEGSGSVLGHTAQIDADYYLPIGDDLTPTGEMEQVAETEMDFRTPEHIGSRIRQGSPQLQLARGYDHNFLLNRSRRDAGGLAFAARFVDNSSGRSLEVWTTEPAVDFYSGNFLDGTIIGHGGHAYRQGDAFAIEPEHPSNAPNLSCAGSTVLRPGETYRSATEYRFGIGTISPATQEIASIS